MATYRRPSFPVLYIAALLSACTTDVWPRPAAISQEQFVKEFVEWRQERRRRLIAPGSGPVLWVGLWELKEGDQRMGADSTLPIVLPASQSAALAGTIHRAGNDVTFEPVTRTRVQLVDSTKLVPIPSTLKLESDRGGNATVLASGSLRMHVHGEPGTDRLWLRVWDEAHPARLTFKLPDSYALDTTWRLAARFDRFDSTRAVEVPDIAEGTQVFRSPGTLAFQVGGKEHRLVAFADSNSTSLFIMLWDSTATLTTYQAGRYLRTPLPDSTGWTVLDFNRTYNPPCVFTPHSTCAFPPRENRLPFPVTAGELRLR